MNKKRKIVIQQNEISQVYTFDLEKPGYDIQITYVKKETD